MYLTQKSNSNKKVMIVDLSVRLVDLYKKSTNEEIKIPYIVPEM